MTAIPAPLPQLLLGCIGAPPRARHIARAAAAMARRFHAQLVLLHVGPDDPALRVALEGELAAAGVSGDSCRLLIESGDVDHTMLSVADRLQADLIVAGTLERESLLAYYLGSSARNLVRKASCSVLLVAGAHADVATCGTIAVETDLDPASDGMVRLAMHLAAQDAGGALHVLHEYQAAGLRLGFHDDLDERGEELALRAVQSEEENRLLLYLERFDPAGLRLERACLRGKRVAESVAYARSNSIGLLILAAPQRRLGLVEKLFRSETDAALEALPCATLFYRPPADADDDSSMGHG
jgi:nucleotide-binding universal stress UspA family protein